MVSAYSRPLVLIATAAIATILAACEGEGAANRYEQWSESVATIPLMPSIDGSEPPARSVKDSAPKKLQVELLTPHELWDARNGPINIPTMTIAAAPAVSELPPESPTPATAPKAAPVSAAATAPAAPASTGTIIQLGAFSSEALARAAWERLVKGNAASILSTLQPVYQPVKVGERQLVRLRVQASNQQAQNLCQMLASADPWCQRPAT